MVKKATTKLSNIEDKIDTKISNIEDKIETPKRKRTTKAEKAEKDESKAKISEQIIQEKFTAEISGVQCEGVMVKFDDRSIYLCQDFVVGGFISKRYRQGYKFSIFVGYGEIDTSIVKNFKIIS